MWTMKSPKSSEDPASRRRAFHEQRLDAHLLLRDWSSDVVGDGLRLTLVAGGAEDEVVGDGRQLADGEDVEIRLPSCRAPRPQPGGRAIQSRSFTMGLSIESVVLNVTRDGRSEPARRSDSPSCTRSGESRWTRPGRSRSARRRLRHARGAPAASRRAPRMAAALHALPRVSTTKFASSKMRSIDFHSAELRQIVVADDPVERRASGCAARSSSSVSTLYETRPRSSSTVET